MIGLVSLSRQSDVVPFRLIAKEVESIRDEVSRCRSNSRLASIMNINYDFELAIAIVKK